MIFASLTFLAFGAGNVDALTALLKRGASLHAVSRDQSLRLGPVPVNVTGGKTALHFAAENGCDAAVKVLLACPDIRVEVKDNDGNTALDLALLKRNPSTAALLTADASLRQPWSDTKIAEKNLAYAATTSQLFFMSFFLSFLNSLF